jgi:hypothetical protein
MMRRFSSYSSLLISPCANRSLRMSSARGQPIEDVANARFAEPKRARERRLIGLAGCGELGHSIFDAVQPLGESAAAQM